MATKLFDRLWGSRKVSSEESRVALLSPGAESQEMASQKHVCVCDSCGEAIQRTKPERNGISPQWAVIICLLCTIVNCLVTIDGSHVTSPRSIPIIQKGQYDNLKRPSPFIGLEKLRRPTPPESRTLLNYPQIIAQIDAQYPNKVFDDDPRRYMSHTGYVSPEDRRVLITPSISTIAQFRAIDFGMEQCELKLMIPANRTSSFETSFLLSIHRLDKIQPIDTKSLAFSNSPRRLTTVANLELVPDTALTWQESFHCAWDDVLTFEIGCSDQLGFQTDACSLEWWQNKEEDNPSHGIFIVQHSTV